MGKVREPGKLVFPSVRKKFEIWDNFQKLCYIKEKFDFPEENLCQFPSTFFLPTLDMNTYKYPPDNMNIKVMYNTQREINPIWRFPERVTTFSTYASKLLIVLKVTFNIQSCDWKYNSDEEKILKWLLILTVNHELKFVQYKVFFCWFVATWTGHGDNNYCFRK